MTVSSVSSEQEVSEKDIVKAQTNAKRLFITFFIFILLDFRGFVLSIGLLVERRGDEFPFGVVKKHNLITSVARLFEQLIERDDKQPRLLDVVHAMGLARQRWERLIGMAEREVADALPFALDAEVAEELLVFRHFKSLLGTVNPATAQAKGVSRQHHIA